MNFGAPQAGGKPLTLLLSSRFSDKVYMGPGQLYQDLQNLLHDLNVVGQISQLIGNLRGSYQVSRASGMGRCLPRCLPASRSVSTASSLSSPGWSSPSWALLLFGPLWLFDYVNPRAFVASHEHNGVSLGFPCQSSVFFSSSKLGFKKIVLAHACNHSP